MTKNRYYIILTALLILIITGCGNALNQTGDDNGLSTIQFHKDGSVSLILRSSFDKDYYKEDELISMVNEEITEFNNANGQGKITLGSHSVTNGMVSLELNFSDVNAYNTYMPDAKIYFGNVAGAQLSGYDLNRSLSVAGKTGSTIGKNDLINMSDNNVIIFETPYCVETPSKILYYSQGMDYINQTTVSTSVNGVYFVVYK